MPAKAELRQPAAISLDHADTDLIIRVRGNWHLSRDTPGSAQVEREVQARDVRRVLLDASGLARWDSSLVTFVARVAEICRARRIEFDRSGLPEGVRGLLELAEAVPEKDSGSGRPRHPGLAAAVGEQVINWADGIDDFFYFLGEVAIALGRFMSGSARYRPIDLRIAIQDCGADAFGIVTLISFLVGTILAFMGAVQLEQFGAAIYVADLVGIGIVRDMGAMMTAIIMAGRTGAAFAAQLGTMKVTQEIDALTTMGLSPIEFLVAPRVVALFLMMPLLCVYSDFVGILGGASVGAGRLGISYNAFFPEVLHAVHLGDIFGGILKATVYGVIVAIAGCLRGFQCGNSASAVGDAATAAVVTGIVYIVAACGVFAVIFHVLGI